MIAPLSEWPTWVRIAVIAPLAAAFSVLAIAWAPKSTREWRLFGILLACFTVFCVVMICMFHVTELP